jgi:hypothetical protein
MLKLAEEENFPCGKTDAPIVVFGYGYGKSLP